MKTGRLILTLLAALSCTSTSALAAAPRASVSVDGSSVTLGDIFDGLDFGAEKVVMSAPPPGRTVTLDSRQLTALANANHIDWMPLSDTDHVRISRVSQIMDGASIAQALPDALGLPVAQTGTLNIVLDNPQLTLAAPQDSGATLTFSSLQFDPTTQRFSGVALLQTDDTVYAQSSISGKAVTRLDVPVLTRIVRRGEVITEADISWTQVDLTPATQNLLHEASDVIGKAPRTSLRAGTPLRPADLMQPAIIKRGSIVTMIYSSGPLQLTAKGRALNDAALGEPIRVANLTSSRTVEGVASSDGSVRINTSTLTN